MGTSSPRSREVGHAGSLGDSPAALSRARIGRRNARGPKAGLCPLAHPPGGAARDRFAHQKRRRRPCNHRGSSAVGAAVCELRIEALATVPMGHSRAPRFGSSGVLPSAEIRSKASAGEDGLVLLSDWAASSTVPEPSGSRRPASAGRDASNSSNSALSNSSTQTAARTAMR